MYAAMITTCHSFKPSKLELGHGLASKRPRLQNDTEVCKICKISDHSAALEEFESMARRAEASGAAGLVIVDSEDASWKHKKRN